MIQIRLILPKSCFSCISPLVWHNRQTKPSGGLPEHTRDVKSQNPSEACFWLERRVCSPAASAKYSQKLAKCILPRLPYSQWLHCCVGPQTCKRRLYYIPHPIEVTIAMQTSCQEELWSNPIDAMGLIASSLK